MLGKLKSKKLIKASFILLLSIFVYFVYWFFDLHRTIEDRIAKNWFLPPIEYYSAPEHFTAGMKYSPSQLKTLFKLNRFQEKAPDKRIQEKTFSLWQEDQCLENLSEAHDEISHCVIFNKNDLSNPQDWGLIAFNSDNVVTYVFSGQPLLPVDRIELDPRVFAQFYDGQPMLRRLITINETPLSCLNAITSIEDKDFLNHQGVSFRAITRALL
ncbi:MAG: transglycosylase domain-containing protein, partial [Bdellovibrionales bacterium]|nr:transglycosylase domain-containing protein [Bdellovibrionales bacterium]